MDQGLKLAYVNVDVHFSVLRRRLSGIRILQTHVAKNTDSLQAHKDREDEQ